MTQDMIQKKRILYQADHRGCKEADIILGRFAVANVDILTAQELDILEELLTLDDELILCWVMGKEEPPQKLSGIIRKISETF